MPADPAAVWTDIIASRWHDARQRAPPTATGTAVRHKSGQPPAPIRWVPVRDPSGEHDPQGFPGTEPDATPERVPSRLVRRRRVEATFQEVHALLGVGTRRQWPDPAILRTTPALPGLFSPITFRADGLVRIAPTTLHPNTAAWHHKREPAFSGAIAAVRRVPWCPPDFSVSRWVDETIAIPATLPKRLVRTPCLAAWMRKVEPSPNPVQPRDAGNGRDIRQTFCCRIVLRYSVNICLNNTRSPRSHGSSAP